MLRLDVLEHLWNGFDLRQLLMEETLFARGDHFDRHIEAVSLIEGGDDLNYRLAAP